MQARIHLRPVTDPCRGSLPPVAGVVNHPRGPLELLAGTNYIDPACAGSEGAGVPADLASLGKLLSAKTGGVLAIGACAAANKASVEVSLGHGLPTLPKRLVDRMLAWDFIDLGELPPARVTPKEPIAGSANICRCWR